MSHVAINDLVKRYNEMNTALRMLKEQRVKADKTVNTTRGYVYALRNILRELGVEVEEVAWP